MNNSLDGTVKTYKRNINIDLAKILACCGVVLMHALFISETPYTSWHAPLLALSYFSVPFFMMATGYNLFNRSDLSTAYVAHKIASILRLGAIWAGLYAIFHTVLSIVFNEEYSLINTLVSLPNKFLHALAGEERSDSSVVLWYLGALMLIYVCAYIIKKYKLNLVIVWLSALLIGVVFQILSYVLGKSIQEYFTLTFRLWSWVQYSLLGALMPRIVDVIKEKLPLWLHGIFTAAALAAYLFFWKFISEYVFYDMYPERFYDSLFLIIFIALFFSFILRLSLGDKLSCLIEKLCPLTVGVFLIHIPLILAWTLITNNTVLSRFVITYLAALLFSFLISFFISKTKVRRYLLKI